MTDKLPPKSPELDQKSHIESKIIASRSKMKFALSAHQIDANNVFSEKVDIKQMTDWMMEAFEKDENFSDAKTNNIRALFNTLFTEFNNLVPFSKKIDSKLNYGISLVLDNLSDNYKTFNIARFTDLRNQLSLIFGRILIEGSDYIIDDNSRITNDFIEDVNSLLYLMLNSWNAYEIRYLSAHGGSNNEDNKLTNLYDTSSALRTCILGMPNESGKKVTTGDILDMIKNAGWSTPFIEEMIENLIKEASSESEMEYINTEDIADRAMEQIMQAKVIDSIARVTDGNCAPEDVARELKSFISFSLQHKRSSIAGQRINTLRNIQRQTNLSYEQKLKNIQITLTILIRSTISALSTIIQKSILEYKKT